MDLGNIDLYDKAEEGRTLRIKGPNGEPTDIEIDVVGADSSTFREASRTFRDKIAKERQRSGFVTAEFSDRASAELYARCTKGWRNITENGKPVEFSLPNAIRLYSDHAWLSKQVIDGVGDRDSFLSQTSSPTE